MTIAFVRTSGLAPLYSQRCQVLLFDEGVNDWNRFVFGVEVVQVLWLQLDA